MKITGIIAEYNPLTKGHVYHLEKAREETSADALAVVMSGNFVQRGEPAVIEKYARAELAAKAGADLVAELPTAYAVAPADVFALGAVKTLALLPELAAISFGSECGDIGALIAASEILSEEPEGFKQELRRALDSKTSFPKARSLAFDRYAEEKRAYNLIGILNEPNNVLGISYIKYARLIGLNVNFHTVKRIGSYRDGLITAQFPSATAIRESFFSGQLEKLYGAVPEDTFNALKTADKDIFKLYSSIALYRFRALSATQIGEFYDFGEGLNNRFKAASDKAKNLDELLFAVKSKRYTLARLRRLALYPVLDITANLMDTAKTATPPFRVLAVKKERTDLLKLLSGAENLIMKFKDTLNLPPDAALLNALDMNAAKIYALLSGDTAPNFSALLV